MKHIFLKKKFTKGAARLKSPLRQFSMHRADGTLLVGLIVAFAFIPFKLGLFQNPMHPQQTRVHTHVTTKHKFIVL
jgi:hypothetical protein